MATFLISAYLGFSVGFAVAYLVLLRAFENFYGKKEAAVAPVSLEKEKFEQAVKVSRFEPRLETEQDFKLHHDFTYDPRQ